MSNMISNVDLWELLRDTYPNFKNHTSKGTSDMFTARGFEQIAATDRTALNEFYQLTLQTILNQVNISHAKDLFDTYDVGETYSTPFGGYLQRMAVNSIKPITPAYKNLTNGTSVDPYVVRKGEITDRFFRQNFDYQSLITIPDDALYKNIFASEFGMSEVMGGLMKGLENGWILQKYSNKLECINALINSTAHPLKETQIVEVPSVSVDMTESELKGLWLSFKNTIDTIVNAPQTGAYNALGFESTQDKSRLRLLIRQGYQSALDVNVLASAFNPDKIGVDINIMPVPNFGGLKAYQTYNAGTMQYETPLFPVYDSLGTQIGYNTVADQTTVTVQNENVKWEDPNDDVIAILIDKGAIFTALQNGYTVQPTPYNPRGMYTNLFANSPNNFVACDHLYNCVVFKQSLPTTNDILTI